MSPFWPVKPPVVQVDAPQVEVFVDVVIVTEVPAFSAVLMKPAFVALIT